jgi:hypothetical protein
VICYAETGAVLAWIHGEPEGPAVLRVLRAARRVIASRLTLFECDRVLRRRVREGDLEEPEAGTARALLAASAGQWDILDLSATVLEYGQRTFPGEPIRSLDAIHLGASLFLWRSIPDLRILTLDARVRANAHLLGFPVEPGPGVSSDPKGAGTPSTR